MNTNEMLDDLSEKPNICIVRKMKKNDLKIINKINGYEQLRDNSRCNSLE